jgi:predicted NUDIX family NTP pyrophosphohydrolase
MLSAGIVFFRRDGAAVEMLLLHHGGPFWARKDDGAWSIPKGLCEGDEDPLEAARREFSEETGGVAVGPFLELGSFRLSSDKTLRAWACEGEFDPARLVSNTFELEWPPRSGRRQAFPEADRAGWFGPEEALRKLSKGQAPVVGALLDRLGLPPI